jgi:hypothetical protein
MQGVDRQAPLVRLPRAGKDAEGEAVQGGVHFFLGLAGLVLVALWGGKAGKSATKGYTPGARGKNRLRHLVQMRCCRR